MAKDDKLKRIADADHQKAAAQKLRISFDYIDWDDDIFFMHGLDAEYYKKLFETLATIKRSTEDEIVQQRHESLISKSIFNTSTSIRSGFPETVKKSIAGKFSKDGIGDSDEKAKMVIDRAFEVRIAKNYGRIHAFVWDKVFHVVWFDPAHNLYPGKESVKKQKDYATVRCFAPDEVNKLQEENRKIVDENNALAERLEAKQKEYDELYELWAAK